MKRLFCVKNKDGKAQSIKGTTAPVCFEDKVSAKTVRRALNGRDGEGNEILSNGFHVSYAPDHRKYRI